MFLLVPAHPGSPGQRAVKRSLLLLLNILVLAVCLVRFFDDLEPVLGKNIKLICTEYCKQSVAAEQSALGQNSA